jgi:hypothetical protein
MSTAAVAQRKSHPQQPEKRTRQLLTRDQHFALVRLDSLLQHREAVDTGRLDAGEQRWLVRALDAAIVSYYRLACDLGVEADGDALLLAYRDGPIAVKPRQSPRSAAILAK